MVILCKDTQTWSTEVLVNVIIVVDVVVDVEVCINSSIINPSSHQVFIIRKSSQSRSLALSVQNRHGERTNVDHYLVENVDAGMRLQGSAHVFHSLPALLAHYMEHL